MISTLALYNRLASLRHHFGWLLEGLDQGILFDGSGFGFGFGHPGTKIDSVPETESTPSSGG